MQAHALPLQQRLRSPCGLVFRRLLLEHQRHIHYRAQRLGVSAHHRQAVPRVGEVFQPRRRR